jgi:hypothetical protein
MGLEAHQAPRGRGCAPAQGTEAEAAAGQDAQGSEGLESLDARVSEMRCYV